MSSSEAPDSPPVELLGGRMWTAIALLAGIALIANGWLNGRLNRLLNPGPAKSNVQWEVGQEADVQITVIAADQSRLNCAHDKAVQGKHCDYRASHGLWPRRRSEPVDNDREQVIQPYRTADSNRLVLIAGLWAQPELAYRLHQEPTRLYPVKKQLRFVAYCRVKFTGKLEKVDLRWSTKNKWQKGQTALVAEPVHCTLTNPNAES